MFDRVPTDESYTPTEIVEAAVAAMGGIDTDPCWAPGSAVSAAVTYTLEDGLTPSQQRWTGRVWLNPPFSRMSGGVGPWLQRAVEHVPLNAVNTVLALVKHDSRPQWWKFAKKADFLVTVDGYPDFEQPYVESKGSRINFPISLLGFDPRGLIDTRQLERVGRVWR